MSAGSISTTQQKATITFMRKAGSNEHKSEFLKINAEDYKPTQQKTKSLQTGFGPPVTQNDESNSSSVKPPSVQFPM